MFAAQKAVPAIRINAAAEAAYFTYLLPECVSVLIGYSSDTILFSFSELFTELPSVVL